MQFSERVTCVRLRLNQDALPAVVSNIRIDRISGNAVEGAHLNKAQRTSYFNHPVADSVVEVKDHCVRSIKKVLRNISDAIESITQLHEQTFYLLSHSNTALDGKKGMPNDCCL